MAPKKKRGGQPQQHQVTFVPTKMSTRSGRRISTNVEKTKKGAPKAAPVQKPAPKPPVKKLKPVPKPKRVVPGKKKKSEVKSTMSEVKHPEIEEILSEFERDDEETRPAPIEQVFLQMDDGYMDATYVETSETETCKITEQLENLNVEECAQDGIQPIEEVNIVERRIGENLQEQIIVIDSNDEFPVGFITEELVPVGNTEIIIDDDSDTETEPPEKKAPVEKIDEVDLTVQKLELDEEVEEIDAKVEEGAPAEEAKPPDEPKEEGSEVCDTAELPKPKKKAKKKPPKKKLKPKPQPKKEPPISKTDEVRRSSRIKSISDSKQRSRGHGLVKSAKLQSESESTDNTTPSNPDSEKSSDSCAASSLGESDNKPVKVKSRWRRSSELEMNVLTPAAVVMDTCGDGEKIAEVNDEAEQKQKDDEEVEARLKQFVHLRENLYLTDRMACKEAKKMTCDCFLTPEETERREWGCGEDCLNRLLMIECGNLCPVGDRCTNKKFQKSQFAPVEVFKTEKKGLGLRAAANIPYGEFILEYVGEVLDHDEFDSRADDYSNDKNRHYYFMSLRADAIIDATMKGNISRFINHSCDPNAETQKWTVNGELRIGFFSTRTILAGEEITFDYRFQRYGKEAQKCYCEAATCRGWLGEEPDDDEDDEDEEEDEEEEVDEVAEVAKEITEEEPTEVVEKTETEAEVAEIKDAEAVPVVQASPEKEKKKRSPRKKPRKDIFEDLDQLDEEIEMLVTTGLKNQAHTLKLSRLMVRAKEPTQRAKLLRVLRRGELPCRRLFLDYHGLRLIHGYMTDAQDLAKTDRKYESLRLELLQTLATLPIPNKTMLQDSKVLPTVEKWSSVKGADLDSDSSSPQTDQDASRTPTEEDNKKTKEASESKIEEDTEIRKSTGMDYRSDADKADSCSFSNARGKELADAISGSFQEEMEESLAENKTPEGKSEEMNYEEEITALALKLLEEWSNLKEVFKIPKKERIEQMKEHEREANRGYMAGLGLEQDAEKVKSENRYRIFKRYRSFDKAELSSMRKHIKLDDRNSANFPKFGKLERRKMFALQVEQREEERRRKQREMWRQHEQHCILLGTDPRLTAPYDPNRGYQCIWNPQIGQWQNYPLQNPNVIFNAQNPPVMPAMGVPSAPGYPYMHAPPPMIAAPVTPMHPLPALPYQEELKRDEEDCSQVKFMGPIPPPVRLPPKWKCAKDKYGRPYYYHVKMRKSQWEPPPLAVTPPPPAPPEELDDTSETTSSSDTSSLSSDSSSEESDSDDDIDDSKLIMEVRKQMERQVKISFPKAPPAAKPEETDSPVVEEKDDAEEKSETDVVESESGDAKDTTPSVDARLKDILKEEKPTPSGSRKRRAGLVHEIIISPRTEEDRLQFREDLKRYKMNKEKLKREKEMILKKDKHSKEKRHKSTVKSKLKEMADSNTEIAKKIKEAFRSTMATVVVSVLNAYRKPDCKEGRITNTEDFKHLARKLTHFVMLKEMKHIDKIEELVCTDNVKSKAREYIRKYMSKFGENYQKRHDEPDF